MLKGGYKIIDLADVSLDLTGGDAVTVPGVFAAIENNYRKPLLLSGLVIDDVEKADLYVEAVVSSGDYVITTPYGVITITDDDEVTIAAAE